MSGLWKGRSPGGSSRLVDWIACEFSSCCPHLLVTRGCKKFPWSSHGRSHGVLGGIQSDPQERPCFFFFFFFLSRHAPRDPSSCRQTPVSSPQSTVGYSPTVELGLTDAAIVDKPPWVHRYQRADDWVGLQMELLNTDIAAE